MRRLSWLCVCCTLAVAACENGPTDPTLRGFEGTFVLQSLDSASVPALILDYGTVRWYMMADTLRADGRGLWTRVQIRLIDSVDRGYIEWRRTVGQGTYTLRNDTIEFDTPAHCPAPCMLAPSPIGWRTPDSGLVVAYRSFSTANAFTNVSRFAMVRR